jgi:predicted nucleotidyltransferase
MTTLEKNIIKTLAFFDVLKKPLTKEELFEYLWESKINSKELGKTIDKLIKSKIIEESQGFYFLKGNKNLILERKKREKFSNKILIYAKKITRFLNFIPYLEMIAVVGSLSFNNSSKDSDIDLLIITDSIHLRLAGELVFLNLVLLRKKISEGKPKRLKFAPDFLMAQDATDLQSIIEKFAGFRKMYWIYWTALAKPIYVKNKVYQKFINKNKWVYNYLPNFQFKNDIKILNQKSSQRYLEDFFKTKFGKMLENKISKKQFLRIEKRRKKLGNKLTINSNKMIMRFSPEEKWIKFEKEFEKRMKKFA